MENIFKVGDTVYHWKFNNKLKVTEINNDGCIVDTYNFMSYKLKENELSFTPYDLVNGGFSQKRPLPEIKVDTLVYVRDFDNAEWKMRYFSNFQNGKIGCFNYQKKSDQINSVCEWNFYSLTNPLENK